MFVYPVTVNADYNGNIIDNNLVPAAILTLLPAFAQEYDIHEDRIIKFYLYSYTSSGRVDIYLGTANTNDSGVARFTCPITWTMKQMLETSIYSRICAIFTGYTFRGMPSNVTYSLDPSSDDKPIAISRQQPADGE